MDKYSKKYVKNPEVKDFNLTIDNSFNTIEENDFKIQQ